MKKIIIIGAGEFQNPLILKAKEMGYQTHVFAWEDGAVGKVHADFFYPVSIAEKDTILSCCREIQPSAVASIGSDFAAITVNYLMERLGMRSCQDALSVRRSTNKFEMRRALQDAGLSVPRYACAAKPDGPLPDGMVYPVVVKPTDRSGSRAVSLVERPEDLEAALRRAIDCSFEKKAVVESYIHGEEYSCESISWQGRHTLLSVTKKYTTGAPHFIETGHIQPSGLAGQVRRDVQKTVYSALDALGIRYGASHTELRIHDGIPEIIEVGARMGGDCIGSDLVPLHTGYDYMKMVVDAASNQEPRIERTLTPKGTACIRFIFSAEDLSLLEQAKQRFPGAIERVCVPDEPPPGWTVADSSTRLGYYLLSGIPVQEMERFMRSE